MNLKLITLFLLANVSWCRFQEAAPLASKATPKDVAISCQVEAIPRSVTVTLTNHTGKLVYFPRSGPMIDYQFVFTDNSGTRVPMREMVWPNAVTRKLKPVTISTALIYLEPNGSYSKTFPLSDRFQIPNEGGVYRIRVGQVLSYLGNSALTPDLTKVVWCAAEGIVIPAMK